MRRLALCVGGLVIALLTLDCFTPSRPKATLRTSVAPARESRGAAAPETKRPSPHDLEVPADEAWVVVLNYFFRRVAIYDEGGRSYGSIPKGEAQILRLAPGMHSLYATVERTLASLECKFDCGIGIARRTFEPGCLYFARAKNRPFVISPDLRLGDQRADVMYAIELPRESNIATSVWWPKTVIGPPRSATSRSEFGTVVVAAAVAQPPISNITWEREDEAPICGSSVDAGAKASDDEDVEPSLGLDTRTDPY
jgi:hypothetical protein